MDELRLEELSAKNIVAANSLTLKPGQEQFVLPVSNSIAEAYVSPSTSWPRVVMMGDDLVGFIMANFDPDAARVEYSSAILRMNVSAASQGRGVGRFAVEQVAEEAGRRGFDAVYAVWEDGEGGPDAFFTKLGFEHIDETEYGEVIGRRTLG